MRPLLLFVVFACASGCVKELPRAATPDTVAPPVAGNPPAGQGRLVVDVVDGPNPVQRVAMVASPLEREDGRQTYRFSESFEVLCPASPCILDTPPGNVLLGFPVVGSEGELEVELAHVGLGTSVYRRALSEFDGETGAGRTLGVIAAIVGIAGLITGLVVMSVGLSDGDDEVALAGGIVHGTGIIMAALGIWGARADAPTFRPGSAVHFPADGAGASPAP